jgi:hypothetical protein
MGIKICNQCGATTNTAVCNWIYSQTDGADGCYLKWENEKWVKGCAYDLADGYTKPFCDKLLETS